MKYLALLIFSHFICLNSKKKNTKSVSLFSCYFVLNFFLISLMSFWNFFKNWRLLFVLGFGFYFRIKKLPVSNCWIVGFSKNVFTWYEKRDKIKNTTNCSLLFITVNLLKNLKLMVAFAVLLFKMNWILFLPVPLVSNF